MLFENPEIIQKNLLVAIQDDLHLPGLQAALEDVGPVRELEDVQIYRRTLEKLDRDDARFDETISGVLYQVADISGFVALDKFFNYRPQSAETSDYIRRTVRLSGPNRDAKVYIPRF